MIQDSSRFVKFSLVLVTVFALFTEVIGLVVLPSFSEEKQALLIWFLLLFPVLFISLFFVTVILNYRALLKGNTVS